MIPSFFLPPEIATATPPARVVTGTVFLAVLLAAGFTVASFLVLSP